MMKTNTLLILSCLIFCINCSCDYEGNQTDITDCNSRLPDFNRTRCCVVQFKNNSQQTKPICAEVEFDIDKIKTAITISEDSYYPIDTINCNANYIRYWLSFMLVWVLFLI